ncbi:hypothetical protein J3Q09_26005 [Pseudomonas sp. R4-83]|uniref:hypothetical protein n=1 Tax=unclassified Pseudomonas TaxID=196821 RepID=UPI003DA919C8
MRLKSLQLLNPELAQLAEDIAAVHKPEVLKESADSQINNLFDRLGEVARQETACAMRFAAWLFGLVQMKVLGKIEAEQFVARATALGASAVVPL